MSIPFQIGATPGCPEFNHAVNARPCPNLFSILIGPLCFPICLAARPTQPDNFHDVRDDEQAINARVTHVIFPFYSDPS